MVEQPKDDAAPKAEASGVKTLIELAPLLLFLAAYAKYDFKTATGVLVVASVISFLASWLWLKHTSPMLIASTVLVCFFGALTYLLDDPRFLKMKPTAVNLLFAGVLAGGLLTGRHFLKYVLGEALSLVEEGWHKLTVRWIGFFVAMALLNEFVWRTMSEATWVNFKVFGFLPLTILFTIAQMGLIKRYSIAETDLNTRKS